MNRVILIRHSITEKVGKTSSHNWRLSDAGVKKAQELSKQLEEYGIQQFFSSQEEKSLHTAQILVEHLKLETPVITVEDLHESKRETVPFFKNPEHFTDLIKLAMENRLKVILGEETFQDAFNRFSRAVNSLIDSHSHLDTIAIVSHGTVISLFLEHLTGVKAYKFWSKMNMPHFYIWDKVDMNVMPGLSATPIRTLR